NPSTAGAEAPFARDDLRKLCPESVVLFQIHSAIHAGDLVGVAVEEQRLLAWRKYARSDHALRCLAPSWMIDRWIHIGVKAIFIRCHRVPCGLGHVIDETQLHDRLATLEAILPGNVNAHGRAVLIRQYISVETEDEQRQRMHGFVHAKSFTIGPLENVAGV